jgi:hypothetical protein
MIGCRRIQLQAPYYAIATLMPHFSAERHTVIAEAAYFRAQRRGFEPGHELEDWLAAELEIAERFTREGH